MRHEWDIGPGVSLADVRARLASDMSANLKTASAQDILAQAVQFFGDRLAMVSSFGAESVVLLHMVARIDRSLPVLFMDTEMLFPETLTYQLEVADRLNLLDVRKMSCDPVVKRLADPNDDLHASKPDDCCYLRKTLPLETALIGFDGWITGRKRHQTADRADMAVVEVDGAGRLKFNPLANWDHSALNDYLTRHDLPRHPLVARGYASIGCQPCTTPVRPGEDPRSGRWRGVEKTECGIHFGPDGKIQRQTISGKEMRP